MGTIKVCTGVCSICTRDECILDTKDDDNKKEQKKKKVEKKEELTL